MRHAELLRIKQINSYFFFKKEPELDFWLNKKICWSINYPNISSFLFKNTNLSTNTRQDTETMDLSSMKVFIMGLVKRNLNWKLLFDSDTWSILLWGKIFGVILYYASMGYSNFLSG